MAVVVVVVGRRTWVCEQGLTVWLSFSVAADAIFRSQVGSEVDVAGQRKWHWVSHSHSTSDAALVAGRAARFRGATDPVGSLCTPFLPPNPVARASCAAACRRFADTSRTHPRIMITPPTSSEMATPISWKPSLRLALRI